MSIANAKDNGDLGKEAFIAVRRLSSDEMVTWKLIWDTE